MPIQPNKNIHTKNWNILKLVGDDGLSSYMILNMDREFMDSIILSFFKFIFKKPFFSSNSFGFKYNGVNPFL
jgi:hypothetical protein